MRSPAERLRPLLVAGMLAGCFAGAIGLALAGQRTSPDVEAARKTNRLLVTELRLTDLALWSEATYCRHPTQADRFAAWADHPGALEHFPAGSIVPAPRVGSFERVGSRSGR